MLTQQDIHFPQETGPMSATPPFHSAQDVCVSEANRTLSIPQAHDRAARRLFGHPEVVADLLRGFVPTGPLQTFDPASLSPRPDDRVSARLERRQSDLTWTFSLTDGSQVVLIIEVQSTVDRTMAARITVQTGMVCEYHLRSTPAEPLPGVLPLVFYTGRERWRAVSSFAERSFAKSVGLLTYFAHKCYFLVEARRSSLD